jgi:hypothetical protein
VPLQILSLKVNERVGCGRYVSTLITVTWVNKWSLLLDESAPLRIKLRDALISILFRKGQTTVWAMTTYCYNGDQNADFQNNRLILKRTAWFNTQTQSPAQWLLFLTTLQFRFSSFDDINNLWCSGSSFARIITETKISQRESSMHHLCSDHKPSLSLSPYLACFIINLLET